MIAINELGQVVNEQGQVFLRYMQESPMVVSCNGHEYAFVIRGAVTMAFVDPTDVDCLLGVRKGCNCNGGSKKNVIFLADERHAKMWIAGGGRGD